MSRTPTLDASPSGRPGRPGASSRPDDTAYVFRRATRNTQDRVVGGVAAGLAEHLGMPVLWVRVAFVVAAALGGAGLAMYAGLWMMLPTDERFAESAPGLESASRRGSRPRRVRRLVDAGPAIALGALGFGVVLLLQSLLGAGSWFWPLLIAAVGIALLWRQADEAQRERWVDSTGRLDPVRMVLGEGTWQAVARVAAGAALIITAVVLFGLGEGRVSDLGSVLLAAAIGFLGLAIVVGPWVLRLAGDLTAERAERVRTQERADMAAHLHDSVLQTLALIQKNAHDSAMVARLARSQERDLRAWLFEGDSKDSDTLAGAMRTIAAEVEDHHGVDVDLVCVGDCPFTEPLRAVVAATREALVNAAKHAGTGKVDVYVEVSPAAVEVFVRDRGVGFDPGEVPEDRQGVRGSIVDRMERHGGSSEIRSTPGEGTEVRLRLPRTDKPEEESHA
ncbi:PspC domain-containing protein [Nocardioides agariphilus]|jgi:signal transduction histidine kinase|uniref:PspC domain-containing protein n=1 Tax=Nocardioides agariphilus TaxID=433664 RepID=A0A930VL24_9ACTN|nr:ATP-binding protein [Nocardioides agariphilus]MBF4769489.1 PspC domain-containing protein [Nocardioides agariphilus]